MKNWRLAMIHGAFGCAALVWVVMLVAFVRLDVRNLEGEAANLKVRAAFEKVLDGGMGGIVCLWAIVTLATLGGKRSGADN